MRTVHKTKTEVDLKVPVDTSQFPTKVNDDCFGEMWDMSSIECPQCADKDLCAILYKGKVDARAVEIRESLGLNNYLDEVDFDAVTDKRLFEFIKSGETTTAELKAFVAERAKCDDSVSVVNFIKNWIQSRDNVSTKGGVVWLKDS